MNINIYIAVLVFSFVLPLNMTVFAQNLDGNATMRANRNIVGNAANFIVFAPAAAFAALPAGIVKMSPE